MVLIILLSILAQATPVATLPPAQDAFGMKELQVIILSVAGSFAASFVIAFLIRGWGKEDSVATQFRRDVEDLNRRVPSEREQERESDRIWEAIREVKQSCDSSNREHSATIQDVQRALLRLELGFESSQSTMDYFKEFVRIHVAPQVPRPNPLTDATNETVWGWHEGRKCPPQQLLAAAEELKEKVGVEEGLTEVDKLNWGWTATMMYYDAQESLREQEKSRRGV